MIYTLQNHIKSGLPLLQVFPVETDVNGKIKTVGVLQMDSDVFATHCREIQAKGNRPGFVWDADNSRISTYQQTAGSAATEITPVMFMRERSSRFL